LTSGIPTRVPPETFETHPVQIIATASKPAKITLFMSSYAIRVLKPVKQECNKERLLKGGQVLHYVK
jgi:hypothetical protein